MNITSPFNTVPSRSRVIEGEMIDKSRIHVNPKYEDYYSLIIKLIENYNSGIYTLDDFCSIRNILAETDIFMLNMMKDAIEYVLNTDKEEILNIINRVREMEIIRKYKVDELGLGEFFHIFREVYASTLVMVDRIALKKDQDYLTNLLKNSDEKQLMISIMKSKLEIDFEELLGIESLTPFLKLMLRDEKIEKIIDRRISQILYRKGSIATKNEDMLRTNYSSELIKKRN